MGMDRKIEKPKNAWMKKAAMIGGGLVALVFIYTSFSPGGGRTLKVDNDRIVISSVTAGQFDDFIPVRGRVEPRKTVYLDAIEGGRVEAIHIEDGASLQPGQLLVELSNTTLQLNVLGNEARVTEQLNNLRSLEISLEQNRLNHKRNIVEMNYQIIKLKEQIKRTKPLVEKGAKAKSVLIDFEIDLDYFEKRLELTLESQATDKKLQETQMVNMRASAEQLEKNLDIARKNLENLAVRAPVSGKLTAFDIEIGQSLSRGERIGQIDDPTQFKVSANIDEFYLGRVDLGQTAELTTSGTAYTMRISKVYPNVVNGQFEVDLLFTGDTPQNIRRGQTLNTRLQLGDPMEALLIPNGAFYQDTGGNWVFVVSSDGSQAVKRNVRLGRRNLRFIEVLDGLEPGEKVITSPYTNYVEMDRLEISAG
jgi:HlyD family secretion protein